MQVQLKTLISTENQSYVSPLEEYNLPNERK